jgi:hypothetical protein
VFKNCSDAEKEFEKCWHDPKYTAIQLDDVDVNHTLSFYNMEKPLHFTKTMLWDMEKKKAWNPANYIGYVIKKGSAKSWDKHPCPETGGELFVRCSSQKMWLDPTIYENVYEEVYVNERTRTVTFLGVKVLPGKNEEIHPAQPLFHVQHGVAGTEDQPRNTWRIVHLTDEVDHKLINHFNKMNDHTLPGFIEAYIKKDLYISIKKK